MENLMGTTRAAISEWFDRGIELQSTHMIIVCDTFDHDDYPVYVSKDEDVRAVAKKYDNVNMQRIVEIYSMSLNKDMQLNEFRAFHWY